MRRMYSENQLRDIIENSDIDFKGDIKIDGESVFAEWNGTITLGSLTVVSSFCKVVRNFNELQFIFNVRVKNKTAESITIPNDSSVCQFRPPEEIQNKIYAHSGEPCSYDATISRGAVAMTTLYISKDGGQVHSQNPKYIDLYHYTGKLFMYLEGGAINVNADEAIDLEARISLAL